MLILVMGVTAAGKTTVGRKLAARLGVPFYDADDFHPEENKKKMAANLPLDDGDRRPWLERLSESAEDWERGDGALLACSALKRGYRELLFRRVRETSTVFLEITRAEAVARLELRRGKHAFIGNYDRVLSGQYADLEVPEPAIRIPATLGLDEVVERAASALFRSGFSRRSGIWSDQGDGRPLDAERIEAGIERVLENLGPMRRLLLVPPDFTRFSSGAGDLAALVQRKLAGRTEVFVLPAIGTHAAVSAAQIERMFPGMPADHFLTHDYRHQVRGLGSVPGSFVSHVSSGRLDFPIRCELASPLVDGGFDRILSIGQVVPHEVAGIGGHAKNLFIGLGGKDAIDRTHFLSAVSGLESTLGRAHTPVRDVLSYMRAELAPALPVTYLMSVRGRGERGPTTLGLFAGNDESSFYAAAALARQSNVELLTEPLRKVVVYLDPEQYRSTWLGNKAVYRTRLAIADCGELIVLAPGVDRFGEDPEIDRLIRRHGYFGTAHTLDRVKSDPELAASLASAAHLIHGSSEGRFRIRYAAPRLGTAALSRVGYESLDLDEALALYDPRRLRDGANRTEHGEDVFYVSNPGLGLWSTAARFAAGA